MEPELDDPLVVAKGVAAGIALAIPLWAVIFRVVEAELALRGLLCVFGLLVIVNAIWLVKTITTNSAGVHSGFTSDVAD